MSQLEHTLEHERRHRCSCSDYEERDEECKADAAGILGHKENMMT